MPLVKGENPHHPQLDGMRLPSPSLSGMLNVEIEPCREEVPSCLHPL
jgi:hypothetical protein